MASLWDVIQAAGSDDVSSVTKELFGEMVHSDDPSEVNKAMAALESAGDYDNLPD